MRRMKLDLGTATAEVYVLCRVFKLTAERIGLKIYVDPETARENGEIEFSIHTWAVKAH